MAEDRHHDCEGDRRPELVRVLELTAGCRERNVVEGANPSNAEELDRSPFASGCVAAKERESCCHRSDREDGERARDSSSESEIRKQPARYRASKEHQQGPR